MIAELEISPRIACPDDAPGVHAIMSTVFESFPNEVWDIPNLSNAFESGESLVLEKAGRLIGYCLVRTVLDEAEILSIAIIPSEQNKGAAASLLTRTLSNLERKKTLSVYLEVRESNTYAEKLYLKHGFACIGKRKDYYTSDASDKENAIMYKYTIKSEIP